MQTYIWTPDVLGDIARARSYEHLAETGAVVLAKIRRRKIDLGQARRPTIQICGPITTGGLGSFEKNMARLNSAVDEAIRRGHHVFDQRPFQSAMLRLGKTNGHTAHNAQVHYDHGILEVFYTRVFESGYLHQAWFLPRWETSKGATFEREKALQCGMVIKKYPHTWLT